MPEPLPRYERPAESAAHPAPAHPAPARAVIPPAGHEAAIAASSLSEGSRALLRGLMRLGRTATFRGGGVGLDYAGLLKSAVRPDILAGHVAEATALLRQREVDLLLVPGMSGFPIGTMYAAAAGIPALLLRKEPLRADVLERTMPPGAFILPSYTSAGEVVMSADPAALLDITAGIFSHQARTAKGDAIPLRLRVAGADDIIDKATMARAVSESARHLGRFAAEAFRRERRGHDPRPVTVAVELVTWVTPLLKAYNHPDAQLAPLLETPSFAGLRISGIYTAPRAVGIEGVGVLGFDDVHEG